VDDAAGVYHAPVRSAPLTAAIAVALLAAATSGCATYRPRPGRFISQDADGIYHRDGKDFDAGMFGGTAESLVNGNVRALEHARRYKHLNHVGLPIYLVGLATMLVLPFVLTPAVPEGARAATAWSAIGLGLGLSMAGGAIMIKGNAALIDAVNVYNDDVADPARAGRP
jgi:hypothetical protein